MIFKQGVLKEEKIKFLITVIGPFIPFLVVTIVGMVHQEFQAVIVLLTIFLPLFSLILLFGLMNLEWFNIYEDRIEARYLFGIKNIVYFDNVLDVQQVKINLTTRGMEKEFYIFNTVEFCIFFSITNRIFVNFNT